ncbi:MAG: 23S rRNA (adenine(2503)-C(2))-methyltransferase RlmN [Coriobacteriales bacterium]|jgi:23S rRNA (adenine2503-C2)-methyltransferase|nr:23S rRNA (adenine(2503)-C(2))-methyltransferase RlmN [Coriobacteriales bacterium]
MSEFPRAIGIKRYGPVELAALLAGWGQPQFRARQLLRWLYGRAAIDYAEMSNLPASLRQRLAAEEPLAAPLVVQRLESVDGSRKYLLELADGQRIETVAIPDGERLTVCFSTQVGCAMGCAFCATGRLGLVRSLAPGEMLDQLLVVTRDFDRRVTNAVAMGEGEPLANYDATLAALRLMNSPDGLSIGARHLTLSTCGLLGGLRRLSSEPEQFTLAVSLHSAVQATRNQLMPALSNTPLPLLRQTLSNYAEKTGRRPSLEYALIAGVNDTEAEIAALLEFCHGLLAHVNLIPLNSASGEACNQAASPDTGADAGAGAGAGAGVSAGEAEAEIASPFSPTPAPRVREIVAALEAARVPHSLRRSRGADIQGACGQLAAQ